MFFRTMVFALTTLTCSTALAGEPCYTELKAALPAHGTVVFGELHGTEEIPDFVFQCVKEFADRKETVRVFLEFAASENARAASFMRGEVGESELLSEKHWSKRDGRASIAMLSMMRKLRSLSNSGVLVFGFDQGGAPDREQAMMDNFITNRSANGYNIVLTGNLHARLTGGVEWNPALLPFALRLKKSQQDVLSFNAAYQGGTAWICMPECGANEVEGTDEGALKRGGPRLVFSRADPAFDGYFRVGKIHASPDRKSVV